jgi:hypothetical protein
VPSLGKFDAGKASDQLVVPLAVTLTSLALENELVLGFQYLLVEACWIETCVEATPLVASLAVPQIALVQPPFQPLTLYLPLLVGKVTVAAGAVRSKTKEVCWLGEPTAVVLPSASVVYTRMT